MRIELAELTEIVLILRQKLSTFVLEFCQTWQSFST